jgi:hypothetical protein
LFFIVLIRESIASDYSIGWSNSCKEGAGLNSGKTSGDSYLLGERGTLICVRQENSEDKIGIEPEG